MALTTIKRPIGHRFATTPKTAVVDNSFNYAQFTSTAHGLTTGDTILIQGSPTPAYDGIWYADVSNANVFFIRPAAGIDYVAWVADASVPVYSEDLEHMWSAVHLPIVYEVTNSLFPFNTATALGIVSINNNNGYARLRLTGDFSGSSDVMYPLEFIRITNAVDSRLNGIWQIQEITYSGGQAYVTIDLAYSGSYNQASSQVRRYYSNYALIIRVYAGITSGALIAKKPVELAATLKYIPDSNNKVRFSISEILKAYVRLRNGIADDTMPNQLDFLTEFYVTYQETYDYSFGYTLLRSEGSITSDTPTYVGKAVNSKLIFGNVYSGYLSEYLMNISTAKFLTLFAIPVLFSCQDSEPQCNQDISFILPTGGGLIRKDYLRNGGVITSVTETIPDKGPGVYRWPIGSDSIDECAYDQIILQLIDDSVPDFALLEANQVNYNAGSAWTETMFFSFQSIVNVSGGNVYTDIIFSDEAILQPGIYGFDYEFSKTEANTAVYYLVGMDAANVILFDTLITSVVGSTTETGVFSKTITEPVAKIGIRAQITGGGANPTVYAEMNIMTASAQSSEAKTIKVDCGCSAQEIKLTWVNNLGGFEYWTFKAEKDYMTEVTETQESEKNVLPEWPQSYGHTADTLRHETLRRSRRQIVVRSQNGLTIDEAFALAYIKSSPLVQMIDADGRRTVTVDTNTFRITSDGEKLREIEFTITETADIPAQTS